MNKPMLTEVHKALLTVQTTLSRLQFSQCDQDDIGELIDRVEEELHSNRPSLQIIGTFLNSIARSLRTESAARDACLRVSETIDHLGVANTWES